MSQQSILSAQQRYASLMSQGGVTNIQVTPGYGISYMLNGVAKSGKITEIQANDQDYITTFNSLANGSANTINIAGGGASSGNVTKAATINAKVDDSTFAIIAMVVLAFLLFGKKLMRALHV